MIRRFFPRACGAAALAALVAALAAGTAAAQARKPPGFVDGKSLIELAGADAVSVEVNLSGALIRAAFCFDADLCDLVRGLEGMHAVVLDLSEGAAAGRRKSLAAEVEGIERRLLRGGWERVVMIREDSSTVRVLMRARGELVDGLVVMVVDEDEVVFTNLTGQIDLAKLQRFGEQLDLPGFDDIDLGEVERGKSKKR